MNRITRRVFVAGGAGVCHSAQERPNFVFILTDDHRWDGMGCAGNAAIRTPNIDRLAARGVRFSNAFVTMSVCSASRAAILTGHYGSRNGVMGLDGGLRDGEKTFSECLRDAGYLLGYAGKWHIRRPATPEDAGFERAAWFYSNGAHFDRKVTERGIAKTAEGPLEDYLADQAIGFLRDAAASGRPFFLHLATQLPHLDNRRRWNPSKEALAQYEGSRIELPRSWDDSLVGKPEYLKTCRNRTQGLEHGYDRPDAIRNHTRSYYATLTDLDARIGRVLGALETLRLDRNTYVFLMGDNGWFLGEHGFTSKVLPYEESMRVPMLAAGPGFRAGVCDELVLNVDVAPTLLELAGVTEPARLHGRSLRPLAAKQRARWRSQVYYEALKPELGTRPLVAIRDHRWKYVQTLDSTGQHLEFEELYDLERDAAELKNIVRERAARTVAQEMRRRLAAAQAELEDSSR